MSSRPGSSRPRRPRIIRRHRLPNEPFLPSLPSELHFILIHCAAELVERQAGAPASTFRTWRTFPCLTQATPPWQLPPFPQGSEFPCAPERLRHCRTTEILELLLASSTQRITHHRAADVDVLFERRDVDVRCFISSFVKLCNARLQAFSSSCTIHDYGSHSVSPQSWRRIRTNNIEADDVPDGLEFGQYHISQHVAARGDGGAAEIHPKPWATLCCWRPFSMHSTFETFVLSVLICDALDF